MNTIWQKSTWLREFTFQTGVRFFTWSYFIFLLFFVAKTRAQTPRFLVSYSEPLAVFVFVDHLANTHSNSPFKSIYNTSAFNTQEANNRIAKYQLLNLDYSYAYNEYPYASKLSGSTIQLLKKNLIESKDIQEFKIRALGILPNDHLQSLCEILTYFTPVYRRLVYEESASRFEAQLNSLKEYMNSSRTTTCFESGLHFYDASWNNDIPFNLCVYPLPRAKGFTAEAFHNKAICAIPLDMNDYSMLVSVMLHELFHILYDEQSLYTKVKISEWFNTHPSKCSQYAFLLMNEALATTLGNGYAYEQLSGKVDPGDWYDWPYINQMAKKMMPIVQDYLKQGKAMDSIFVDQYVATYTKHFSDWITEPKHLMSYRSVVSEHAEDFAVISARYPNCSFFESQEGITESSLDRMLAVPMTKMVIASKNHRAILNMLEKKVPELRGTKVKVDLEGVRRFFLRDRTQLFVIIQKNSDLSMLLDKLEQIKIDN